MDNQNNNSYCINCLEMFPEDEMVKLCDLQEVGVMAVPKDRVEHCTMMHSQFACGIPILKSILNKNETKTGV